MCVYMCVLCSVCAWQVAAEGSRVKNQRHTPKLSPELPKGGPAAHDKSQLFSVLKDHVEIGAHKTIHNRAHTAYCLEADWAWAPRQVQSLENTTSIKLLWVSLYI